MPAQVTEQQLRHIYRDTIGALYGYASRKCGGQRDVAEDVTQEVWLRAIREWPRTGVPDNPLAWLTTVARNLVINHFRKREGVPIDMVRADELLAAIDDDSGSVEVAQIMARAMAHLPTAESQLLEAFHYERRKVAQLADSYGISERAVEGRLRRAREHLRVVLVQFTTTEELTS